ncbi:AraC family transcriptional regulator [Rivibacter subsaxonicus]|uniref:AraC family transcriptional regulator n=1 Tax=Rivibacter subsaxonicus TaxID=457575 RepID=A0A4Q7VB40_9BURK|nr:AraC family transcriptional regulator [Rivibacter subsaxonicus]RZT93835.1 AraC family transcriptional regulator [Rivibacter subsaxonicus]
MTSLVRTTVLHGYEKLARSIGADPAHELKRVGLSLEALKNPDSFISFIACIRVLEHTASTANCPDLGLRLIQAQQSGVLGPLTALMRHAPTLEQALLAGSRHLFVLSPEIHFAVAPVASDRHLVDLTFEIAVRQLTARAQIVEQSLGFIVQVLRLVTQGRVRPLLALVPHSRLGSLRRYAEVLGCECQFDTPVAGIRIAASDLAIPLPEHNPLLQQMAQTYIEECFGSPQQLFSDRVRLLIRRFLDSQSATLPVIADDLAIHPKTLQRRLLAEGHQFKDLLDEVRRDRFLELVAQSGAFSLTQLALLLGYSEQAALTRSCRRWFGCSPTVLRRRSLPNPSESPPAIARASSPPA